MSSTARIVSDTVQASSIKASKAFSSILRHRAVDMGLNIRRDGFVRVDDLLRVPKIAALKLSIDNVHDLVNSSDKKRFELLEEDGELLIRAAQGHTLKCIDAEALLTRVADASAYPVCVHGTYMKCWPSIREQGLKTRARNHVHFSSFPFGSAETISGMRSNCEVLIHVDLAKCLQDGIPFYVSSNKVLLTPGLKEGTETEGTLPPRYFARVERVKNGEVIGELSLDGSESKEGPEKQQEREKKTFDLKEQDLPVDTKINPEINMSLFPLYPHTERSVVSALCLIPPREHWDFIQQVRALHDKSYIRWMPHINMMYPFVPPSHLMAYKLVHRLKAALAYTKPFTVHVKDLSYFQHKGSCTVFLDPVSEPEGALERAQARFEAVLPHVNIQSTVGEHGWRPHISIAQTKDKASALALIKELSPSFKPFSFTVDSFTIIIRTEAIKPVGSTKRSKQKQKKAPIPSLHAARQFDDGDSSEAFTIAFTLPVGPERNFEEHDPPVTYRPAPRPSTSNQASQSNTSSAEHKEAPGAGKLSLPQGLQAYRALPSARFDSKQGHWIQADEKTLQEDVETDRLKVLTYNILFDTFDSEKLHTEARLPEIVKVIKDANADIVGLQEVKAESLAFLLNDPWIRSEYYVSDNGSADTVKPSGQLILSRYPFRMYIRPLNSGKKLLTVGALPCNERVLLVPVLHLPAGVGPAAAEKRARYLQAVYEDLSSAEANSNLDCLMLGDFNSGDEDESEQAALSNDYVDLWQKLHPDAPGYTFDPTTNPLAQFNSTLGTARRLDRIFLRVNSQWKPESAELVGTQPFEIETEEGKKTIMASDHYGISCTTGFKPVENSEDSSTASAASSSLNVLSKLSLQGDVEKYIRTLRDSDQGDQRREAALDKLRSVLPAVFITPDQKTKPPADQLFKLYPIGSYALGTHSATSDIDVICVANLDRADFFRHCQRVLTTCGAPGIEIVQVLNSQDALVPVIKLIIDGVHIDLQYACITPKLGQWFNLSQAIEQDAKRMDSQTMMTLNGYRDLMMLNTILSSETVKKRWTSLFLIVKEWAKRQGVYSNRMGFLGGYGWTILTARVCQLYPKLSTKDLIGQFFSFYASWSWDKPLSLVNPMTGRPPTYHMESRDQMAVVTLNKPHKNSARNVTRSTRQLLEQAFLRACEATTLEELLQPAPVFSEASYLQVRVAAVTASEFIEWTSYVESRLVMLMTKIEKVAPSVLCRPYTNAYKRANDSYPLSCAYYIGLSKPNASGQDGKETKAQTESKESKSAGAQAFAAAVDDFLIAMYQWKNKSVCMDLNVKHIKREQVGNPEPFDFSTLRKETKEENKSPPSPSASVAGISAAGRSPSSSVVTFPSSSSSASSGSSTVSSSTASSSSSSVVSTADATTTPQTKSPSMLNREMKAGKATEEKGKTPATAAKTPATKLAKMSKAKRKAIKAEEAEPVEKVKGTKTEDVFNRIRWDPSFDSSEFIIGFEDRLFGGIREQPYDEFRTNEDEWIPFHRVRYFKQRGEVVWDRTKRIDLLAKKA